MSGERVELEDGKYLFALSEDGRLYCERYSEPWRSFLGDKAVHALFQEVLTLRASLAEVEEQHRRNKAKPPLTSHEALALTHTLDYCRDEEGKSQKGYFSSGWAGIKLAALLARQRAAEQT